MTLRFAMAVSMVVIGPAGGVAANDAAKAVELIRDLRKLEDRMAAGDNGAHRERASALEAGARLFRSMDASALQDARASQSLLIFILGGGPPSVMRSLATSGNLEHIDRNLRGVVLALAEGRTRDVDVFAESLKIGSLDQTIAIPLSLALSVTAGKPDVIELLELATIRWPGSALEEAALRRLTLLAIKAGDLERAKHWATKYARRFPKSIFFESLSKRVVAEIVALSSDAGLPGFEVIRLVAPGEKDRAVDYYLAVSRYCLLKSRIVIAKAAAEVALRESQPGSRSRDQAQVYVAAAVAPTGAAKKTISELSEMDPDKLDPRDDELRRAAMSVARRIVTTADEARAGVEAGVTPSAIALGELKVRARQALDAAAEIVK